MHWAQLDDVKSIIVAVVYGATDSRGNSRAHAVTEKVLGAVKAELAKYTQASKMICEGSKGDHDSFTELEDLKGAHALADVRAVASRWQCEEIQPTCLALGSKVMTGRDDVIMCPSIVRGGYRG